MAYINEDCEFCKIIKKEIIANVVYEDERIISFLDIDPINNGHLLIIPKKHCLDLDDLGEDIAIHIMKFSIRATRILKKIFKPDGYTIMQNGGYFNDIGHYHMHIFPRFKNDEFRWTYGEENQGEYSLEEIKDMITKEFLNNSRWEEDE